MVPVSAGAQGVVGLWLHAIRAGSPITLFGDGGAVRDFVYIADVADAIECAADVAPQGIINLGSGVGTSLAQLLEVIRVTVAPHEVEVMREPARGIDPAANWLDVSRAHKQLGWQATTSLADGIARTWASVNA